MCVPAWECVSVSSSWYSSAFVSEVSWQLNRNKFWGNQSWDRVPVLVTDPYIFEFFCKSYSSPNVFLNIFQNRVLCVYSPPMCCGFFLLRIQNNADRSSFRARLLLSVSSVLGSAPRHGFAEWGVCFTFRPCFLEPTIYGPLAPTPDPFFPTLDVEPRALDIIHKDSAAELHCQPQKIFILKFYETLRSFYSG